MMSFDQKRVVIIDGYLAGRDLLRHLLALNVECLHLQSSLLPLDLPYDANLYDADLGYLGDLAPASEVLAAMAAFAVLPGSESGIELAEELSTKLGMSKASAAHVTEQHASLAAIREACRTRMIGRHFIVAMVGWDRQFYVTSAWRVLSSNSSGPGIHGLVLLDPANGRVRRLIKCARAELARLGIRNGAAYTLLRWVGAEPSVVGTATCLLGVAISPLAYAAAGLNSQANLLAEVLVGADHGNLELLSDRVYQPARIMAKLISDPAKPFGREARSDPAQLHNLPSFVDFIQSGTGERKIVGNETAVMEADVVYLVHDDIMQILKDIVGFGRWMRGNEFYREI